MERSWRIVHIAAHGEPPEKIGPVPQTAGDPPQQRETADEDHHHEGDLRGGEHDLR